MKDSFYFSHDFNTRNDPKIEELIMKHGMIGYGIFWGIVEMLAQETGRWFLPRKYDRIAFVLREDKNLIKEVVEDFDLFIFDEDNFWNKRLDRYFDERAKKSEKARLSVAQRWDKKKKKNTTVIRPNMGRNTIKERKGKEIKKNITKKSTQIVGTKAPLTPRDKAERFFGDPGMRSQISNALSEKYKTHVGSVESEVEKFASYWSELTPDGKKQRWQMQKTFEVTRRLGTWFQNKKGSAAGPKMSFSL